MSSFFDAVDRMHKNWRSLVVEANELGLRAVYVRDREVVWHFADNDIVSDTVGGDRVLAILNTATDGERGDMARRIRTRHEALAGQPSGGDTSVDWDEILDQPEAGTANSTGGSEINC